MRGGTTLLVILWTMATVAQAADPPIVLPPGPAKATIEAKCKRCHDLKKIVKQRQDPKWWAATLDKMVDKGLEIEPEDQAQVVKYLSKNFGVKSGGGSSKASGH
jgi:hypothetical protein